MSTHGVGPRDGTEGTTRRITILDGGMGKELRRIGAPFRQPEWSALALIEAPEFVEQAHRNFVEAGAEVIITNTYALVPFHIGAERFEEQASVLATLAATLARNVADEAGGRPDDRSPPGGPGRVTVAGSLPPMFGSYLPEHFKPEEAPAMWQVLIEAQAPSVDLWIGETLSSTTECRVLAETVAALDPGDRPVWTAFTLANHLDGEGRARLRSGEPMSAVADLIPTLDRVQAVLVNCSQPEVIGPALVELAAALPGMPLGAYANAFPADDTDDGEYAPNSHIIERREDLTPERYAELAEEWVDAGATLIGGCCDIYPEHIAALAARF